MHYIELESVDFTFKVPVYKKVCQNLTKSLIYFPESLVEYHDYGMTRIFL